MTVAVRLARLARERLGLPAEAAIAVYAGRVNERKGLDQILALADLRPDTLFLLVGSEAEGPVEAEARRRPNVRVVAWQGPERLPWYLAAADLLLIPAVERAARAVREQRAADEDLRLSRRGAADPGARHSPTSPACWPTAATPCWSARAIPQQAAAALDRILGDPALAPAPRRGRRRDRARLRLGRRAPSASPASCAGGWPRLSRPNRWRR